MPHVQTLRRLRVTFHVTFGDKFLLRLHFVISPALPGLTLGISILNQMDVDSRLGSKISGSLTLEQANVIAMLPRSGTLPGRLIVIEQQVVEPEGKAGKE